MIVYAGKQFWNDFNNWDEGVFQDANRPRDYDKFKLRPWLQSDKWRFRDANKDTDFSMIMLKWWGNVPWTASGKQLLWRIPKLQETWTDSDISAAWFPARSGTSPELLKMEKQNNPSVYVRSGTITYQTWDWGTWLTTDTMDTAYFEIAHSWLYFVVCYWSFYFDTAYYDSSTSYQYKEWVWIAQWDGEKFFCTDRTQQRACGNWDAVRYLQVFWLPRWSRLLPIVAHSFTSWTNTVFGAISVIRMW